MDELRVVAGVVVRDGRVLVARRGPGMTAAGEWECPGGKVEAGETDADALVRELDEELGIGVEVGPFLTEVRVPRRRDVLVLRFYTARLVRGEPAITEHDAVKWVTADELDTLKWQAADEPAVEPIRRFMTRGQ
mgnify:CR=1 FL=1